MKHIKVRKQVILSLFIGLITMVQAQDTMISPPSLETQADKDWEHLKYAMGAYGTTVEEQAAKNESMLELQKYYDTYFRKRSQLANAFWNNYPEDSRRDQALYYFFSVRAEPSFIPAVTSDSLKQVLAAISNKDFKKFRRLQPVDHKAWKQWRKTGDNMVASVLNSNASLERKEGVHFQLIAREFRQGLKLYNYFPKEKSESEYWNRFERQYWQHIRLLLENHVNTYAALDIVADRVQNILSLFKIYSLSAAADTYWHYFYKATGSENPLADQPGIIALHKLAKENTETIEALKLADLTKPLNMAFTAMDRTQVDLNKMRGKVVLIDFWATYCGPCIKEMPHVRAMYDKYREQGFEVIGIAADGDAAKERIEAILKKTGANWPQRLDKGADAKVSLHALYKIKALPTVWLLNKEGVIVDRDARGERLEPLIRKYLNLEK